MRDYKFKAWHKSLSKWVSFSHKMLNNPSYETPQYTGLKDKNGKEIYEGDILGYWGTATWEVGWDEGTARYVAVYSQVDEQAVGMHLNGYRAFYLTPSAIRGKEVLGNIYENPDLLK